jgi:hypothetical protein
MIAHCGCKAEAQEHQQHEQLWGQAINFTLEGAGFA